jgi:hypothetical protein
MKNAVFWNVTPVALVKTDVSEDLSASIIRVTRIGSFILAHQSIKVSKAKQVRINSVYN